MSNRKIARTLGCGYTFGDTASHTGGHTMTDTSDTEIAKSTTRKKSSKSKSTAGLWGIKGIDNETRSKTKKAAAKRKETIGSFANRALLDAANEVLASKTTGTELSTSTDDMMLKMFENQERLTTQVEALVEQQNKPLLKRMFR